MIGAANGPRRHLEASGDLRQCIPFPHHIGQISASGPPIIRLRHSEGNGKNGDNEQERACKNDFMGNRHGGCPNVFQMASPKARKSRWGCHFSGGRGNLSFKKLTGVILTHHFPAQKSAQATFWACTPLVSGTCSPAFWPTVLRSYSPLPLLPPACASASG